MNGKDYILVCLAIPERAISIVMQLPKWCDFILFCAAYTDFAWCFVANSKLMFLIGPISHPVLSNKTDEMTTQMINTEYFLAALVVWNLYLHIGNGGYCPIGHQVAHIWNLFCSSRVCRLTLCVKNGPIDQWRVLHCFNPKMICEQFHLFDCMKGKLLIRYWVIIIVKVVYIIT